MQEISLNQFRSQIGTQNLGVLKLNKNGTDVQKVNASKISNWFTDVTKKTTPEENLRVRQAFYNAIQRDIGESHQNLLEQIKATLGLANPAQVNNAQLTRSEAKKILDEVDTIMGKSGMESGIASKIDEARAQGQITKAQAKSLAQQIKGMSSQDKFQVYTRLYTAGDEGRKIFLERLLREPADPALVETTTNHINSLKSEGKITAAQADMMRFDARHATDRELKIKNFYFERGNTHPCMFGYGPQKLVFSPENKQKMIDLYHDDGMDASVFKAMKAMVKGGYVTDENTVKHLDAECTHIQDGDAEDQIKKMIGDFPRGWNISLNGKSLHQMYADALRECGEDIEKDSQGNPVLENGQPKSMLDENGELVEPYAKNPPNSPAVCKNLFNKIVQEFLIPGSNPPSVDYKSMAFFMVNASQTGGSLLHFPTMRGHNPMGQYPLLGKGNSSISISINYDPADRSVNVAFKEKEHQLKYFAFASDPFTDAAQLDADDPDLQCVDQTTCVLADKEKNYSLQKMDYTARIDDNKQVVISNLNVTMDFQLGEFVEFKI